MLIRYLIVMVIAAIAIIKLSGCGGSLAVASSQPDRELATKKVVDQLATITEDQPRVINVEENPVALDRIKQFADAGAQGIYQLMVVGTEDYQDFLKMAPKLKVPVFDDWILLPVIVMKLAKNRGNAYLFWTRLKDDSDVILRQLLELTFLGSGKVEVEVAAGGAVLRYNDKAPLAKNNSCFIALYFHEPHETKKVASSFWEIRVKEANQFGSGSEFIEKTRVITRRGKDDLIWLKVRANKVELYNAANLRQIENKSKPDLVCEKPKSVTVKRIDPK